MVHVNVQPMILKHVCIHCHNLRKQILLYTTVCDVMYLYDVQWQTACHLASVWIKRIIKTYNAKKSTLCFEAFYLAFYSDNCVHFSNFIFQFKKKILLQTSKSPEHFFL